MPRYSSTVHGAGRRRSLNGSHRTDERAFATVERFAVCSRGGDRSTRRLLCNLRQTDRPRGQADDRADASRQSKHGGLAGDAGDRRRRSPSHPDANSKPPGAVLKHVLSALRQADAKLIG